MKKFKYVLMTTGKQKVARIAGRLYTVNWNAPYHSKVRYIMAHDEESAREEIRGMLKNKYIGFKMIRT